MIVPSFLLQRLGCFSDTGFFYALHDPNDKWHAPCVALLSQVQRHGYILVTTNLVIAETHALLLHRKGRAIALAWLDNIEHIAQIERATKADEIRAKEILRQYLDQDFTFTDAISFAVIERLGLRVALSVDRHFEAFKGNFVTLPLSGTNLP